MIPLLFVARAWSVLNIVLLTQTGNRHHPARAGGLSVLLSDHRLSPKPLLSLALRERVLLVANIGDSVKHTICHCLLTVLDLVAHVGNLSFFGNLETVL